MNPFAIGPDCYFDNGQLTITGTFSPPNYRLTLTNVILVGTTINVETNILMDPSNITGSFILVVNITPPYSNTDSIRLIINNLADPNAPRYDQLLGAAINLPPKNIGSTSGSVAQGAERMLFIVELEMLSALDQMLMSFSQYYQKTFKAEVPKGYTDFVKHIENAQKSLKSVIEVIKE